MTVPSTTGCKKWEVFCFRRRVVPCGQKDRQIWRS